MTIKLDDDNYTFELSTDSLCVDFIQVMEDALATMGYKVTIHEDEAK